MIWCLSSKLFGSLHYELRNHWPRLSFSSNHFLELFFLEFSIFLNLDYPAPSILAKPQSNFIAKHCCRNNQLILIDLALTCLTIYLHAFFLNKAYRAFAHKDAFRIFKLFSCWYLTRCIHIRLITYVIGVVRKMVKEAVVRGVDVF